MCLTPTSVWIHAEGIISVWEQHKQQGDLWPSQPLCHSSPERLLGSRGQRGPSVNQTSRINSRKKEWGFKEHLPGCSLCAGRHCVGLIPPRSFRADEAVHSGSGLYGGKAQAGRSNKTQTEPNLHINAVVIKKRKKLFSSVPGFLQLSWVFWSFNPKATHLKWNLAF